jgi:hypothetical protein
MRRSVRRKFVSVNLAPVCSLIRIRRPQIPLVQQVAGNFRKEARRLLHSVAAGSVGAMCIRSRFRLDATTSAAVLVLVY